MAATPKPIRKEANKFGNKIKEAAKNHPKMPAINKTSKGLKGIKKFNTSEKKRVLKEGMK
jgi:hypothetical protein